jgi:hypothetical protein
LSEAKAFDLLKVIAEQRKKIDEGRLNRQKYKFIKEIKHHYNLKDFMNARIPSYKVYASIYKVFDGVVNEVFDFDNIAELVDAKFTLVEHLAGTIVNKDSKNDTELFEVVKSQEEDLRLLSYRILIERFNEKYENLNDRQKNLLREYIYNVSNPDTLKQYAINESSVLIQEITKKLSNITNQITKIKLLEVISQLNKIKKAPMVKENHMTALLIALEIAKTLDNIKS